MEILALHLAILRNEEHYKFGIDFAGLVSKHNPETLGIQPLFPAFQSTFSIEVINLDVVRGSAVTDELVDFDIKRDVTFSGLAGTVKAALNHFIPEVRAAAARLQKLLDTYGNLAEKPYDQETAAIYKLVDDMQGNYSDDATTVGITGWVEELSRLNHAFDTLKNSRYTENASKPQENLKLARKATDKAYQAIVKRINALIEVNGETAYTAFVGELNQRIENYNILLAQRQGRNAKKAANTPAENSTNQ